MQQLAQYFASIGFKVDQKQLKDLDNSLKKVENSLKRFINTFDTAIPKIERGLAKAQNAQKRQLDIEGKQIRNATAKGRLDSQNLKTQLASAKVQAGMLRLKEAEQRISEKVSKASGWKQGPSRSDIYKLRDRAAQNAPRFGPSRAEMYRLRDAFETSQIRESSRDAWRSRKRVQDVGVAEEMAYAAQQRKDSWHRQGKGFDVGHSMSTGMGMMRGLLPGFGAMWSLSSLNRMSQEIYAVGSALQTVSGSAAEANSQMAYLNGLGKELGVTTREIGPQYARFLSAARGTALEGSGAQSGFKSFVKYAKVSGADPESTKGSLVALTQMMAKRKVMAEELVGQLSEHMPAAIPLFAKAAGMTPEQLLAAKGTLKSEKLLPKVFELMEQESKAGWDRYLKSTQYQQGRFRKQWEDTVKVFSEKGFDQSVGRFFKALTTLLEKLGPILGSLSTAFNVLSWAIKVPLEFIGTLIDLFNQLPQSSQLAVGAITAIIGVIWLLNTKIGRITLTIALAIIAVSALSDAFNALMGNDSTLGQNIKDGKWGQVALQFMFITVAIMGAYKALKMFLGVFSGSGGEDGPGGKSKNGKSSGKGGKGGLGRLGRYAKNPYVALAALATYGIYDFTQTGFEAEQWKGGEGYGGSAGSYSERLRRSKGTPSSNSSQVQHNEGFNFYINTNDPLVFHDYFKKEMSDLMVQVPLRPQ
jgi:tape measure domain-containing protein